MINYKKSLIVDLKLFSQNSQLEIWPHNFLPTEIYFVLEEFQKDIERVAKATGAILQSTTNGLTKHVMGTCGEFEEVQIGAERFNILKKCPQTKTTTIVLRGGAEQFIQEAKRSLNDAIMIVRRATKTNEIVPGGGAIELEVSK